MTAAVIPGLLACASNPVCATGAAVIAFGGAMMAAQNTTKPQGMLTRKEPAQSGLSKSSRQYEGLVKDGYSSPPDGPQNECDQMHDRIQNKLLEYAEAPAGHGNFDIEALLRKYTVQCKDVDPNFQVKHDFLKAKHNVMNFYDDLKANYWSLR